MTHYTTSLWFEGLCLGLALFSPSIMFCKSALVALCYQMGQRLETPVLCISFHSKTALLLLLRILWNIRFLHAKPQSFASFALGVRNCQPGSGCSRFIVRFLWRLWLDSFLFQGVSKAKVCEGDLGHYQGCGKVRFCTAAFLYSSEPSKNSCISLGASGASSFTDCRGSLAWPSSFHRVETSLLLR